MRSKSMIALVLSLLLVIGLIPQCAFADDSAAPASPEGGYVLMNIPYAKFYEAELAGKGDADAVSAATKMKRSNGGLASGSYHVGAEGDGVDGVIYPVKVADMSVLDASKEVTDDSSIDVTTTAKGKTSTTTYSGKDALFEAPDYAWYKLAEGPSLYKELKVAEDGSFSFGAIDAQAASVEGIEAAITYNGRHTDLEIVLSGDGLPAAGDAVSGVIITTADGKEYGLGHVTNIWRGTQIGWNADEVTKSGKDAITITNIRYITKDAVTDYPVNIEIKARDEAGFTNLEGSEWYADAARWAVGKGYITSRGSGEFDASQQLTRADVVSYLYSAAGKPEPTITENPFSDIKAEDSFYKAVLWAYENKITDGIGDGRFTPEQKLDRATVVTFLWKQAGKPEPASKDQSFSDVAADSWYADSVNWAVEKKITDGTGDGKFSPVDPVTLGHVVTFLYRSAAE